MDQEKSVKRQEIRQTEAALPQARCCSEQRKEDAVMRRAIPAALLALAVLCTMGAGPGTAGFAVAATPSGAETAAFGTAVKTAASGTAVKTGADAAAANSAAAGQSEEQDAAGAVLQEAADAGAGRLLAQKSYARQQLLVVCDASRSAAGLSRQLNRELRRDGADDAAGTASAVHTTALGDGRCAALVTFSEADSRAALKETLTSLQDSSGVLAVQPNYRYHMHSGDDPLIGSSAGQAYQFQQLHIKEAWSQLQESGCMTGRKPARAAVIDTGCDVGHEDLQETLDREKSKRFVCGRATALTGDTELSDGHGTHVTGLIGATYGNGRGSAGVASGFQNNLCSVTVYGVSEQGDDLYSFNIVAALRAAEEDGAKVVNMSWGASQRDYLVESEICRGYYEKNICYVAAGGNDNGDKTEYPAAQHEVLGVIAGNEFGESASYSAAGANLDLMAPGSNLPSTIPGDHYEIMSGTSMASPILAGIAVLVRDANPDLTPAQVCSILRASAVDKQAPGFDNASGWGLVDAEKAVEAALAANEETAATSLSLKPGMETVSLTVGETFSPEVLVKPAASLQTAVWSSSSDAVAAVDETGRITARGPGSAVITGRVGTQEVSVSVQVMADKPLQKIEITNSERLQTLHEGEMATIVTSLTPADASRRDLIYSCSDYSVIRVDAIYPYLIAAAPGRAVITVTSAADPSVKASVEVTVRAAVTAVRWKQAPSKVRLGSTASYQAVVLPAAAPAQLHWRVSDSTRAKITDAGVLHPKRAGSVYVIAEADNGLRTVKKVTILKKDYRGGDYRLRAAAKGRQAVRLTWKRIPDAAAYRIEVRAPGKRTYRRLKTVRRLSCTHSGLKNGTWRYRIRACYREDGLHWYSYSNIVKVRR
jgi:subtilisin family serine protease